MNQEQEIKTLKEQVRILTERLNALSQSNTIPLDVERSFVGRGFLEAQINPRDFNEPSWAIEIDTSIPQVVFAMGEPIAWGALKNSQLQIPMYAVPEFP